LIAGFGGIGGVAAQDIDHENPDEIDTDGDLEQLRSWFGTRVGEMHVDCAEGIEVGDFDACEDLDSDEYDSLIDRYVTVEGDLEGDAQQAERFNETSDKQREYAELRAEFEETYEAYQAARAAGNEEEALALARELQRLAERIEALGGELEVTFRELDDSSGADLTRASEAINRSTADTRTVTLAVESETFTETRVTASANRTASFDAPAQVTGRVVDTNGSAITGGRVVVSDGSQTIATTTDETGRYAVSYRPVATDRGATTLEVSYRPATADPYLGSATTAETTVRETNGSLVVDTVPATLRFADQQTVVGRVMVRGTGVEGVPVGISVDGVSVTTTQTDASGRFETDWQLPVTVPPGETTLTVRASRDGAAIRPIAFTPTVSVEETPTELQATASVEAGALLVSGRLTAAADRAVGSRPLSIRAGETSQTITTDSDGRFTVRLQSDTDGFPETVQLRYEEPESNLEAATAEPTVDRNLGAAASGATQLRTLVGSIIDSPIAWGTVFVLFVFVVLGARRQSWFDIQDRIEETAAGADDDDPASDSKAPPGGSESETATEVSGSDRHPSMRTLLETARKQVETDPEAAIRTSYAAVRGAFPAGTGQTHREFYRDRAQQLDTETARALEELTDQFEYAAFAETAVDPKQAGAALEAATQCLDSPAID
jgi:hypothetical protein